MEYAHGFALRLSGLARRLGLSALERDSLFGSKLKAKKEFGGLASFLPKRGSPG
jgi:hypothetical protein